MTQYCYANHVVLTCALDSPSQKHFLHKTFAKPDGTLDSVAKAVTSQATGAVHIERLQ